MATKAPRLLHQIQGLEFPDYEFQEYPKHVTVNGVVHTALSKDHEKELKTPTKEAIEAERQEKEKADAEAADRRAYEAWKADQAQKSAQALRPEGGPTDENSKPATTKTSSTKTPGTVDFQPSTTGTLAAAKSIAERLAETPGGVEKKA